jgi:hypothetical protein
MKFLETPGVIKKFRRTSWKFQVTFQTPLQALEPFVSLILGQETAIQRGDLTVHDVVFEPKKLQSLIPPGGDSLAVGKDSCFEAESRTEVEKLLTAAFGEWVDFLFVPTPKPFVIYADHDEYTTFFFNSKSGISQLSDELVKSGVRQVHDYQRKL